MIKTLLLGGRGNIGAGLRTFLPRLDPDYHLVSVDLPGSPDKATEADAQKSFVDLDISIESEELDKLLSGQDLVVYLAKKRSLAGMNAMTDLIFEKIAAQKSVPLVIASSSVHAADARYDFENGVYWKLAERAFDQIDKIPDPIPATAPACPETNYGLGKAYVEGWVKKMAELGHGAIAARWGGINDRNQMRSERGYFAVWCHQEDAARFVHACFTSFKDGTLNSGAHYFVISDNTYNIFDIETPKLEVGYDPIHNAEVFYQ